MFIKRKKNKKSENSVLRRGKIPILIEVTWKPQAWKSTPMLVAVTPFPSPLTTPLVSKRYFIFSSIYTKQVLFCSLSYAKCTKQYISIIKKKQHKTKTQWFNTFMSSPHLIPFSYFELFHYYSIRQRGLFGSTCLNLSTSISTCETVYENL